MPQQPPRSRRSLQNFKANSQKTDAPLLKQEACEIIQGSKELLQCPPPPGCVSDSSLTLGQSSNTPFRFFPQLLLLPHNRAAQTEPVSHLGETCSSLSASAHWGQRKTNQRHATTATAEHPYSSRSADYSYSPWAWSTLKNLLRRIKAHKTSLSAVSLGILGALSFGTPGFADHIKDKNSDRKVGTCPSFSELDSGATYGYVYYPEYDLNVWWLTPGGGLFSGRRCHAPNRPPVPVKGVSLPLPDIRLPESGSYTVTDDGGPRTITGTPTIFGVFLDPDGDHRGSGFSMSHEITSSNPNIEFNRGSITVKEQVTATTTITVTGTDISGDSASTSFTIAVFFEDDQTENAPEEIEEEQDMPEEDEENRPPIVIRQIGGAFGQILDIIKVPTTSFNLSQYFRDPDGDDLTYTAVSSDDSKVRASISGNTLTIGAIGLATLKDRVNVTVTANDGNGGTVSTDFLVTVTNKESSEVIEEVIEEAPGEIIEEILKGKAEDIAIKALSAIVGGIIGNGPGTAVGLKVGDGIIGFKNTLKGGKAAGEILINSNDGFNNETEFNRLAENLYIHQEALQNGNISLDQAFSGQTFSFPLNLSQASIEDPESSSPRFIALFTGGVDFTSFSDNTPGLDFDGSSTSYGLGIDVFPNTNVPLLTGLHLAFTNSNIDFEDTEPDVKGTYNLNMFSIHPSIAWDVTDSLTVWTTLGYGRPNTETTIESIDNIDVEDATHSSSGDFFSVAGGASYRVWQSDASALSLNLSGTTTTILDNDFQEGRLATQFSHDFGQLQTSADLALLLSDSDPSAMELSGHLDWLPDQGRLSGSTNARVLLFGDDRSEWGIGGSVTLLPGERGEGLSIALQPSFGQSTSSLSSLHLDPFSFSDPTELALSTSPLTARLNAEVAYGFRTGNHALLTPYIDASLAHSSNTYTTGLRYELDTGLDLDLSASHRQRSSGSNDNRFFLQLRSDL